MADVQSIGRYHARGADSVFIAPRCAVLYPVRAQDVHKKLSVPHAFAVEDKAPIVTTAKL